MHIAYGNVSPFLQFQPSVHFPAFQVCIGRSIGCHSSPQQTLALLILGVTRPPSSTYMQTPTLLLLLGVTVTSPLAIPPPWSWTTNSQCPGTTPISHRVWKSEHIFVIITHLVLELTAGFAEGGRFDGRETAALVLVVSQT